MLSHQLSFREAELCAPNQPTGWSQNQTTSVEKISLHWEKRLYILHCPETEKLRFITITSIISILLISFCVNCVVDHFVDAQNLSGGKDLAERYFRH